MHADAVVERLVAAPVREADERAVAAKQVVLDLETDVVSEGDVVEKLRKDADAIALLPVVVRHIIERRCRAEPRGDDEAVEIIAGEVAGNFRVTIAADADAEVVVVGRIVS